MIGSYLLDEDGNIVKNLYQWDVNQKLIIETHNIATAPKIHFCNKNSEKALVVKSTISDNKIIADIPNSLLREPYTITAYIYLENNESAKTINAINIVLRKRPQPNDYIYVDDVNVIYLTDVLLKVEDLKGDLDTLYPQVENDNLTELTTSSGIRVFVKKNIKKGDILSTTHTDTGESWEIRLCENESTDNSIIIGSHNIGDSKRIVAEKDWNYVALWAFGNPIQNASVVVHKSIAKNNNAELSRLLQFDYSTESGKFANADGTFTNNNSYYVTNYIVVNGIKKISFKDLGNAYSCFYDINKQFISSIKGNGTLKYIETDVPTNAYYFLSSILDVNIERDIQLRINDLIYAIGTVKDDRRKEINVSELEFTDNYFLTKGNILVYNTNNKITEYILCKGFEKLICTKGYVGNQNIVTCYYDENKKYLGYFPNSTVSGGYEYFDIPSNACYVRINISKTWTNFEISFKTNILDTIYKNSEINEPIFDFSHLKIHNKVLFIGDSLTEGFRTGTVKLKNKSYPSYSAKLGDWEIDNEGVSGITPLGWWNTKRDTINNDDFDACFIYLGTNEGLTDTIEDDTSSGNYETYADTNTGRYCSIIEKFMIEHPNAKIYLISTTKRPNVPTWPVLTKIGEKYNLPIFEVEDNRLYDLSQLEYHMSQSDMTHYNTVGYWALSRVIMIQCEEYIREHILEYKNI